MNVGLEPGVTDAARRINVCFSRPAPRFVLPFTDAAMIAKTDLAGDSGLLERRLIVPNRHSPKMEIGMRQPKLPMGGTCRCSATRFEIQAPPLMTLAWIAKG